MEYLGKQAAPLHGLSGNTQQHDFSKKTQKKRTVTGLRVKIQRCCLFPKIQTHLSGT
jgi:hypothetical protein